jgi:hypothetical protein
VGPSSETKNRRIFKVRFFTRILLNQIGSEVKITPPERDPFSDKLTGDVTGTPGAAWRVYENRSSALADVQQAGVKFPDCGVFAGT